VLERNLFQRAPRNSTVAGQGSGCTRDEHRQVTPAPPPVGLELLVFIFFCFCSDIGDRVAEDLRRVRVRDGGRDAANPVSWRSARIPRRTAASRARRAPAAVGRDQYCRSASSVTMIAAARRGQPGTRAPRLARFSERRTGLHAGVDARNRRGGDALRRAIADAVVRHDLENFLFTTKRPTPAAPRATPRTGDRDSRSLYAGMITRVGAEGRVWACRQRRVLQTPARGQRFPASGSRFRNHDCCRVVHTEAYRARDRQPRCARGQGEPRRA